MICGMLLKHYAAKNIHRTSRISIHDFLKLIAVTAETLVFLLLGIELVTSTDEGWNTAFVFSAYFFSLFFRAVGVFALSFIGNKVSGRNGMVAGEYWRGYYQKQTIVETDITQPQLQYHTLVRTYTQSSEQIDKTLLRTRLWCAPSYTEHRTRHERTLNPILSHTRKHIVASHT